VVGWGSLVALGAVAVWYVSRVLDRARGIATYDPRGAFLEVQRVVIPILIVAVALGVAIAVYFLVNALRIIRAERFPAPGARLVRTTPIRRGAAAQRIGIAMAALSLIVLAASVAMPLFLGRVMRAVDQTDHRFPATPPDLPPPTPADASQPRG
jgi:hypothetical protein